MRRSSSSSIRAAIEQRRFLSLPLLLFGSGVAVLSVGLLGLGAVVVGGLVDDEAVGDADDEEEPEEVEGLQGGQQHQRDVERDPALVLAALPVELVGADRLELSEERIEDAQVQVVPQVDPHAHEEAEVRTHEGGIEVVERLGGLFAARFR